MAKNLNYNNVKVNLFDSATLEVPAFEKIENEKVIFTLWQNKIVRNYINSNETMMETLFPILTEIEYVDCHSLNYPTDGLLELLSIENTIIDTTIIEHDNGEIDGGDHNINNTNTDDKYVMQIIPLISDKSSYCGISSVYFQSDSKSKKKKDQ